MITTSLASGIALAFLSAFTTALGHALQKSARNKLAVRTLMSAISLILFVPVAIHVGLPPIMMLHWLAASCVTHWVYQIFLIRSYELNDFSVTFPIARGVAPLATAVLGVVFLNDQLTATAAIGIGAISLAIISLADKAALTGAGLRAALITGAMTTLYTIIDAKGVRLASEPMLFIAWFFILDSIAMPLLFFRQNGKRSWSLLSMDASTGIMAGLVTAVSFASALYALALAPVGIVSALRETSVVIGIALAIIMLHEKVGRRRLVGGILVAVGAATAIIGIQ